jgi:hypothetical protein
MSKLMDNLTMAALERRAAEQNAATEAAPPAPAEPPPTEDAESLPVRAMERLAEERRERERRERERRASAALAPAPDEATEPGFAPRDSQAWLALPALLLGTAFGWWLGSSTPPPPQAAPVLQRAPVIHIEGLRLDADLAAIARRLSGK